MLLNNKKARKRMEKNAKLIFNQNRTKQKCYYLMITILILTVERKQLLFV